VSRPDCIREPEVENDDVAIRLDEDIRRLQIEMHFAGVVHSTNAFDELPERSPHERFVCRWPRFECRCGWGNVLRREELVPLDVGIEGNAPHARHGEEPEPFVREKLVQSYELGMHEPRERAKLLLQTVNCSPIDSFDGLQRDDLTPVVIASFVNDPHPAFAEATLDDEPIGEASTH
jgi:hypothetical protein